jgi:hypothetical protein
MNVLAPVDKRTVSEVMREMGRKGGKIGGKRRLETMTPEERAEIARKAGVKGAAARWGTAAKSAEVRSKKAAAKKRSATKKPGK